MVGRNRCQDNLSVDRFGVRVKGLDTWLREEVEQDDGRVNPANSRKMAARLQAASASGWPILLRVSSASGHGIGTALSERIAQQADVYAFLFDQLGMNFTAPAEPKSGKKRKGFGLELKVRLGR